MSAFNPRISRRGNYYFAEVFQAPGPQAIAVTGDNSFATLFGREWLLVLDHETSMLLLYQESSTADGTWVEVTTDLPPAFAAPFEADARRISFAFDQSARIILAYETGGIVKVTRWDTSEAAYIQNVSFAGADPNVVIDAAWSLDVPGSDVLVFYLSTDRTRLLCRVQREVYAVENEIHAFGAATIFDRVVPLPIRYQALVSDGDGEPLTEDGAPVALISDPYPYLGRDAVATDLALTVTSGAYVLVALSADGSDIVAASLAVTAAGSMGEPIIDSDGSDIVAASLAVTAAGSMGEPIIDSDGSDIVGGVLTTTMTGAYVLVVLSYAAPPIPLTATLTVTAGGTYGPP